MFCPKCGALLIPREDTYIREGTFYCAPGDMWLSGRMACILKLRYDAPEGDQPQSPLPAFNREFHGSLLWYCPGCGVRLNEHLECPRCGKHVRDLVYHLIELHPHGLIR